MNILAIGAHPDDIETSCGGTLAKYRGIQCGVEYAEGFRMANDAFRVVPHRVLP